MRWKGRERSENVEDRRGMPTGMMVGGGGILIILAAVIATFMGADPEVVKQIVGQAQMPAQAPGADQAAVGVDDEAREFISVVLRDTEEVWHRMFAEQRVPGGYREPQLVIFSDMVRSGCGPASAAVGPFYCPADQKIYIDPRFFDQLAQRHRAPGDFAQAYVIAHEVAHHVQVQLGYSDAVQQVRERGDPVETNRASVRLELQADYLAGVWAHHAQRQFGILEEGDIEEAITAANQIGDDTLMRESQGRVVPERFTHGTSAQRTRWFAAGLKSGDLPACRELFDLDYASL
jgi:hypothetical protein